MSKTMTGYNIKRNIDGDRIKERNKKTVKNNKWN